MKKFFTILLYFLMILSAFAQDDEALAPQPTNAREKINAARAAYITERLQLTTEEAEKFWPVYREYIQKRQDLRLQYHNAKKSGQNESGELLELDLKIKQQELDLEKEYSTKFTKIISPQKVIALHQTEQDFRRLLLRQIERRQINNAKRRRLLDR